METLRKIIHEAVKTEWGKSKVAGDKTTPPRYVYHISDKINRESILSNGLKVGVGDSYKSWTKTENAAPAIFATVMDSVYELTGGQNDFHADVWQIDTWAINNQWFSDKHFDGYGFKNPHIVTFNNIKNRALSLVYKDKN